MLAQCMMVAVEMLQCSSSIDRLPALHDIHSLVRAQEVALLVAMTLPPSLQRLRIVRSWQVRAGAL